MTPEQSSIEGGVQRRMDGGAAWRKEENGGTSETRTCFGTHLVFENR